MTTIYFPRNEFTLLSSCKYFVILCRKWDIITLLGHSVNKAVNFLIPSNIEMLTFVLYSIDFLFVEGSSCIPFDNFMFLAHGYKWPDTTNFKELIA